jgi:E3 Ubiquitin ligase
LIRTAFISVLLRQSSDSRPIVWCVVGVFAGLYIFYCGFLLLQRRHLILDTPVSKVRSASFGMVELNGLAVGPYTMLAPITARPCYYHRTVAWEWKQRGKNKQWVKVAAECMHLPFFLDDNTGKIMVDPRGAELDLHRDFEQEFCDGFFTTKQEAPPNVRNFLLRYGVSTRNKIKVEEFCIKPKNALFILGTLDENPGLEVTSEPVHEAEPNITASTSAFSFSLGDSLLSFPGSGSGVGRWPLDSLTSKGSSEDERLMEAVLSQPASDRPVSGSHVIHLSPAATPAEATEMTQQQKVAAALVKAGITNPAAWAAAHVAPVPAAHKSDTNGVAGPDMVNTGAQFSPKADSPDGFEQRPRVVLMKGKNNPNFMISWRSQRDVARSLGWKCTLMIWGGPALTVLCLYALHNMTNWF